ncbi:A24 family peptidase [Aquibium microcysteis]|uniref:A24 family peptidase n=1 Tax=Aquibium microcysteis TaxID=675281 RepID=UPI00165CEFD5|nr:prepilin peptidase [Aquibium microcysteis]
MIEAAIFVVFPFCLAFAAVSDLLSMTIANRVSIILVATFAILAPLTGMDWQTYGLHFAAMAVVLAFSFSLFAIGAMGGGDAKLLAATALWMGFGMPLAIYILASAAFGGTLTLAILTFRNSPLSVYAGKHILLRNIADSSVGIPYGIALAMGGFVAFPESPLAAWAVARMIAG